MKEEKTNAKTGDITITENGRSYLLEMAKWSNLLSIFSFIMMGLVGLFILFILINLMGFRGPKGEPLLIVFSGLILMVLYFFPAFYLQKFLKSIRNGIHNNDNSLTEDGLMNLKSFFKFMGIALLVYLGLLVLSLILIPVLASIL